MRVFTDNEKKEYRNIWVVAEVLSGEIQPVTHELIGAARTLADVRKSEVWVVVMGYGIEKASKLLFSYGADAVIIVDDPILLGFIDETETKIMKRLIKLQTAVLLQIVQDYQLILILVTFFKQGQHLVVTLWLLFVVQIIGLRWLLFGQEL